MKLSRCYIPWLHVLLVALFGWLPGIYAADNDGDLLEDSWEIANGFSTNAHAFSDLLGWWQANESTGTASVDRSSHLLDLSAENYAAGFWASGLFGNAATLNGSNQSLTAAQNGNYNLTDFTFSVWVKTSATSGQTLARWTDANGDGWQISMDSSGALSARYDTSTTSNQTFQHGTGAIEVNDNTWHQVAFTYDRSSGEAILYVDGTEEATGTVSGTTATAVHAFTLGDIGWGTANWNGQLDEIRLYDRVLTATEIPLLPETYSDPDGDGLTNLQEYTAGTNPHEADTDGDSQNDDTDANPTDFYNGDVPAITLVSGNNQSGLPDAFTAASLLVEVRNSGGTLLQNAPVEFAITGTGGVSATSGGSVSSSVILRTASNGRVGAYVKLPPEFYETRTVRAKTVSQVPYVDFTAQTYALPQSALRLWLKSDAGVTKDGSDLVATWADQSGNSLNATQSTGTAKPLWVNSVINGLPVLRFDGTNDILNLGNVLGSATAAEIFVILKANEDPPSVARSPWCFKTVNQMNYPGTDGRIRDNFGCSTEYYIGDVQQSLTSFHLYNVSAGSNSWSARINGDLEFSTNPNTILFSPSGNIGAGPSTRYFGGDFAEFIVYTRQLTEAERQGVQKYLQARYAVTSSAPSAPSSLAAVALSPTEVSLTWSGGGQTVVERKVDPSGSYEVIDRVENGSAYLDRTAVAGASYLYRVRNQNMAGYSSYASAVGVSTPSSGTAIPFSNLKFWSRADVLTKAKDSNRITSWLDGSSQAMPGIQSTTASAPIVVDNVVNGRPVLRFDGTDDNVQLSNVLSSATEGEMFIVLKSTGSAGTNRGFVNFGTVSFGGGSYYPSSTERIVDSFGTYIVRDTGCPPHDLSTFHLYNAASKSGDWINRLNGLINFRTTTNIPAFTTSPKLGQGGAYFPGDIAEVMVFNSFLTESQRESVERYLGVKYGLAPSPAVPSELSAATINQGQLLLKWKHELTLQRTNYVIERKVLGDPAFVEVAVVRQASTWLDDDITPGTSYVYRIKADSLGKVSGYSSELTVAVPTGLLTAEVPLANARVWLRGDSLAAGTWDAWFTLTNSQGLHVAHQKNPGERPAAVENVLGGRPVMRFDGANDNLALPDVMAGATEGELFVIAKGTGAAGTNWGFVNFGNAPYGGDGYYPNATGRITDSFGTGTGRDQGTPLQSLGTFQIYNSASKSNDWTSHINGLITFRSTTNTVGFTSGPLIGRTSNSFSGDFAEILVFDRFLTTGERDAVEAFLAAKYDLTSAPPAPTQLSAFAFSDQQLILGWKQELTAQRTDYIIERKREGESVFSQVAIVRQASTWIDSDIDPATEYTYRIKGRRLGYDGDYSASFSYRTPSILGTGQLPLANIRVWLRGDQLAAGATNTWKNETASATNSAFQAAPGFRPSGVDNVTGGRSVMRFATDDSLNLGNLLQGASSAELLVALKVSAAPGTLNGLMNFGTASYNGSVNYPNAAGLIHDSFASNTSRNTGAPAQALNEFHIYGASSQTGFWRSRLNGQIHFTTLTNTPSFTTTPTIGYSGAPAYFNGDLAEVIVFDRTLTSVERRLAERYLAVKYLIPGTDPDEDGLTTAQETTLGSNPLLPDTNGDGVRDGLAHSLGYSLTSSDTDGDGLTNAQELLLGTSPIQADTDGDGVADNVDAYPLDPDRDAPEPPDPGDTTPPVINLILPIDAVPVP